MPAAEKVAVRNAVPIVAVRTAQVLMVAVMLLIAADLASLQRETASWVLTRISILFMLISLACVWCSIGRVPDISQLGFPRLQISSSSRFQHGCHYLSGVFLYGSYYLIMAEASWNMLSADHHILAMLVLGFAINSLFADFPTIAGSNAWAERFFHPSDSAT